MSRVLVAIILVLLLASCAPSFNTTGPIGSGNLVSRSFDLRGFSRIEADSAAQVEVTRGEAFSVEVEVDDNLESRLDVAVVGSTLRIRLKSGPYRNPTLRAHVTMPELNGANLDGGSALRAELAGEDLAINLNGGTRATLTGTAGRVTIDVDGASKALLGALEARDVKVSANGGARVEISASGSVTGQANGGATVVVSGSPSSVNVTTDGGATVTTK